MFELRIPVRESAIAFEPVSAIPEYKTMVTIVPTFSPEWNLNSAASP
jgi:hypothetical protein